MDDGVRAEAGVVENGFDAAFLVDVEEERVAMFGYQLWPPRPVPSQWGPGYVMSGRHENVDGIVDKDCHVHGINGLKMDDVSGACEF